MDLFYNMKSDKFRKRFGALYYMSYRALSDISNISSEISDIIGTRLGNVDGANVCSRTMVIKQ